MARPSRCIGAFTSCSASPAWCGLPRDPSTRRNRRGMRLLAHQRCSCRCCRKAGPFAPWRMTARPESLGCCFQASVYSWCWRLPFAQHVASQHSFSAEVGTLLPHTTCHEARTPTSQCQPAWSSAPCEPSQRRPLQQSPDFNSNMCSLWTYSKTMTAWKDEQHQNYKFNRTYQTLARRAKWHTHVEVWIWAA